MSPRFRLLLHYLVPVVTTLLALALALVVEPVVALGHPPIFLAAVMVSAWVGGLGPGLLATALSILILDYFFIPPLYALGVTSPDAVLRTGIFIAVALITSGLQAARLARRHAEARRAAAESEQAWLHAVLDLMPTPLVLLEPQTGRVLFANGAAHRLAGGCFPDDRAVRQDVARGYVTDAAGHRLTLDGLPGERAARGERLDGEEITWGTPEDRRTLLVSVDTLPAMHGHPATVVMPMQDVTRLKETERKLEQLARRTALILDAAGEGIYGLDEQGRTTFVNPAAAAMLGYTPDELVGRSMHAILHHAQADGAPYPIGECPIYAAFRDGTVHRVSDEVFWRKDGSSFPVEYVSTPKREGDRLTGAVVVFRDITAQRQAEAELRAADARYRSLVEHLPNITYVGPVDAPDTTIYISPQFERALGFTEVTAEQRATLWVRQLHPDDRQRVLTEAAQAGATGRLSLEYRMLTRAGKVLWFHDEAAVIHDRRGRRLLQGVMLDITERKQAEEERDRLVAILEATPDLVGIATANGQVLYLNGAGRRLLNLREGQDLGLLNIRNFFPPEVAALLFDEAIPTAIQRGVWAGETRLLRQDGQQVPMGQVIVAHKTGDGRLMYLSTIAHDLTERKRLDEELEQMLAREQAALAEARAAIRERDEFLASAAHDLKNPLTAIKGQAQLLRRRTKRRDSTPADIAEVAAGLEGIEATVGRMAAHINELVDVARLRIGATLVLDTGPADLAALARRVAADEQRATERHHIRVEAPSGGLIGQWDAARLERVLGNLLGNAVKYSPAGGDILVRVYEEPGEDGGTQAVMQVQDHGLGIPAADLPRVFERFHRGSNVAGRIGGSGLGLAGARQIVERHGGVITIESREGEGTVVTVRLPLTPPDEDAQPAA